MSGWRKLSDRGKSVAPEEPPKHLPDYLTEPIVGWIDGRFRRGEANYRDSRDFCDGETRTRTGDTTIFRHLGWCWSYLAICSTDVTLH